jgi:cell division protein FtsA
LPTVRVESRHKLRRQTPHILGLLDIGTSKTVCCIVAGARPRLGADVEVLGVGQQASRGLKAGVVIELEAAEQSLRAAVSEAERAAGAELRQVLLAVACGRLRSTTFAADAKIDGRAVSEADIVRLMSAGRSYVERDGRALLHMNCLGYRLDGAGGIAEPRGLAGKLLSADLHAVTADDGPLRNLVHVAERAYLSVIGLVPAPYASSLAVTSAEDRGAGVVALDFGAGTTSLALFVDGHLIANDVIPVGGNHVTFDIARAFETSLAEAERIKALYGKLQVAAAAADEPLSFTLAGEDATRLQQTTMGKVCEVIRGRVTGLLSQVAERVDRAGVPYGAIERVVVTGGAGQLAGLSEFASACLRKPVRVGQPQASYGWPASSCSPALSTVLGLSQVAFDPTVGVRRHERMFQAGGYLRSVGRWLQASF